MQRLWNEITYDRLAGLRVPALLLGAGADLIVPAPLTEAIAERSPGAVYELLADSGHTPTWEVPDAFNAAVVRFVGAAG